jgi:signal transduction histidine kinase
MNHNRTGQFGWVVLLLATAVILPTVCLLWFMMQAVRNERLAVRQKLVDIYQKKAEAVFQSLPPVVPDDKKAVVADSTLPAGLLFDALVGNVDRHASGAVIYDDSGNVTYPLVSRRHANMSQECPSVAKAWRLEFEESNFASAAKDYEKCATEASDPAEVYEARTAQARCLAKAGLIEEAKTVLAAVSAYPPPHLAGQIDVLADLILRARVMLAQLYADTDDVRLENHLARAMALPRFTGDSNDVDLEMPCGADTRMWAMGKFMEIADRKGLGGKMESHIRQAETVATVEKVSLSAAQTCPRVDSLASPVCGVIMRVDTEKPLYGMRLARSGGSVLFLFTPESLDALGIGWIPGRISDDVVFCRVYDSSGNLLSGPSGRDEAPFLRVAIGQQFPDWRAELYFRDASVFENVASKQAAVYTWTAILVISLMGSVAIASGFSINKQMKLNRLKNDFVATVTHELKTPLSSMRILVDTLLAGDCKDQKQEREYLELIARENLRLSRLIDNFLTFSRMERNKKAFDIHPAEPARIVADTVEAVKTKFGTRRCEFSIEVPEGLPEVMADHDSIVTVLVNLLDNACKYSGDNKQISLRTYAENGEVCFAVKDNGLGMTKRVMKRIFDRFYQADQSLARSAEGCGLGLSIVKFIVDAHKGRIDVESKPGEGSCFTVRLPAAGN